MPPPRPRTGCVPSGVEMTAVAVRCSARCICERPARRTEAARRGMSRTRKEGTARRDARYKQNISCATRTYPPHTRTRRQPSAPPNKLSRHSCPRPPSRPPPHPLPSSTVRTTATALPKPPVPPRKPPSPFSHWYPSNAAAHPLNRSGMTSRAQWSWSGHALEDPWSSPLPAPSTCL